MPKDKTSPCRSSQNCFDARICQLQRVRHLLIRAVALYCVDAPGQRRVLPNRLLETVLCQLDNVWQCNIRQRHCCGPWYYGRDIRHRIVDHPMLTERWLAVRRHPIYRFDTATLVHRNIHNHRSRLHCLDHLFGDQMRTLRPRDQHRSDQQIRLAYGFAYLIRRGHQFL